VNWKSSLLGALFVAIAGLAVGVAVGGKTTTKIHRVTETTQAASSTPLAQPSSTTTASTSTTTAEPAAEPPTEGQQYLAEYLAGQDSGRLSEDASGVSLSSEPSKQELQGKTYQQAVVFDIDNYSDTVSFQVPTPGFRRLSSKAVGLETVSNAEAFYKLTIYKNDDSSPNSVVLYQATFHGPSEIHKMDFDLREATDLLFVWTKGSSEPDGQDVFILSDPVLSR
jgi:hypothetical protein